MPETANLSGTVIGRRFLLEALAGRGGMGTVWRARDHKTDEVVALKLMRGNDHGDRFVREALVLAELTHPRVVRYIDHGVSDDGDPYLAMEWLDGIDLAQRLAGPPLAIEEAVRVVRHIAEALAVAHARGIVHRDIKPNNVMLPRGQLDALKVLDFGIARLQLASHVMTRTGATLGTPGYMAPEQARGERDVDARADVFALGCVMFEAVTGRPPFVGEHLMAVLAKVLFEDAPRLREMRSDVPASLDALVARMVSKRPADRPADATAVIAALDALGTLASEPPSRPTAGVLTTGEQRLLSVVLAGTAADTIDGSGATAATDEIATQFDTVGVLAPYGATVERLADGSVVAILAGKGAATDQAAQAARCALALRKLRPTVAMALATGRGAVAGRLPVGEVIDRAVRLLGRTIDGTPDAARSIRLDETSAGLLDQRFDVGGDARGLVLHGEREMHASTRTLLGKPTPCVGRERELAMLDGVFAECVADPIAHAVLVTAPAGAGKTRLIGEFLHRRADCEIWIGRGDPISAGSSFAILGQAIRRACGMLDGEPPAVRHRKLRARVARQVPVAERQRVSEFVGEMIACETIDAPSEMLRAARASSVLMNDQMRRAWEDFIAAEVAAQPVVLVLEDLQWGDLPTTKFVAAALRRTAEQPLMVIGVARPEVTETFPNLWAGKHTHLQLGDLTPRAGEKLIKSVLGSDVSPALVTRIVERAAGNAFYLEELIRAVADGKGDALPETVLAMLQARLEALDPEVRRALRAASVFGQLFWAEGVTTLLGADLAVGATLEALVDRELIERRGEGRFPDQDEFAFRHAIVRDAAYSLLTDDDRVLGHKLAGAWLEKHGEPDAIVLAEHYEAGGDRERAARCYCEAAQQALDAHDFDGVVRRGERGLACGATDGLRGELLSYQVEAEYWRGNPAAAELLAREAFAVLERGERAWYGVAGVMGRCYIAIGRIDELIALSRELEACGLDAKNEPSLRAWGHVAMRLLFAGEYAHANRLIDKLAIVSDDTTASPNARAMVFEVLAQRTLIEGDYSEALRLTLASVDGYRHAGNMRDLYFEQIGLALVYNELGAFAEAAAELRGLLDVTAHLGIPAISSVSKLNLGVTLGYLGDPDAERIEREAVAELEAAGNRRLLINARGYLARVLIQRGDTAEALRVMESFDPADADPLNQIHALTTRAHALLASNRAGEAVALVQRAMPLLDELGHIEEGESYIRLVHAEVLLAAGEDARPTLAKAAKRISTYAQRISEPQWRASFLDRVPENVRTLALAHDHGVL